MRTLPAVLLIAACLCFFSQHQFASFEVQKASSEVQKADKSMARPPGKIKGSKPASEGAGGASLGMVVPPKDAITDPNHSLETQKLELEIAKLKSDVVSGNKFEVVKAVGTFLTSLGIIGTLLLGLSQQRQTRISRDDERFERSVTRLGSQQIAERLTGLAGLRPFLQSPDRSRQISALNYLVNAGVIEPDPTVRSAIENLFDSISNLNLDAAVLNEGLTAARDRNRAVYIRATNAFIKQQTDAKKRLVDEKFTEVLIGNPPPEEISPLEISSRMIAALVRAGASIEDLSKIYCPNCSFSSRERPARLVGVSFENAILRRAVFTAADLELASFHNADLILADFIGAKLVRAKFTADSVFEPWSISAAANSGELASSWGTIFACSDLSYADFGGRTVFTLIYRNGVYGGNMRDEFNKALLVGTKFREAAFTIAVPLDGISQAQLAPLLPAQYSPMTNANFSVLSGPVNYFKETKLTIWKYFGGEDAEFKPLPNEYGPDLTTVMSGFLNARSLDKAELPKFMSSFINQNRGALEKPLISYNCSNGQKSADISGMFSQGGAMTGNARF
ncbi:pentapeptide repeat-containing protein [Granulicella sibirica]|uniref:Pentapeptide repeat family protein n=1 Tax=Granulicella sibirica TaxID=2479048 RepID=A0A4Q0T0S3_9BACT|nr:pentapeptide repeat-containing protein [Granulicella sibirica]RXH57195.1 hypothetical protein GRAN_0505 [Granulicella sibirica]